MEFQTMAHYGNKIWQSTVTQLFDFVKISSEGREQKETYRQSQKSEHILNKLYQLIFFFKSNEHVEGIPYRIACLVHVDPDRMPKPKGLHL